MKSKRASVCPHGRVSGGLARKTEKFPDRRAPLNPSPTRASRAGATGAMRLTNDYELIPLRH
ncbi:MAG TPA: hypothetical protein VK388_01670 [Pyrinomonadaceae bacterium]|nr:hypothetical protein [Pyrinomonadaceae bacterium]